MVTSGSFLQFYIYSDPLMFKAICPSQQGHLAQAVNGRGKLGKSMTNKKEEGSARDHGERCLGKSGPRKQVSESAYREEQYRDKE